MYRLSELASNPAIQTHFANITFDEVSQNKDLALFIAFAATLICTIFFHTGRLTITLFRKKSAYLLGVFVLVKAVLLILDLTANGILLYETLIYKKMDIFGMDKLTSYLLSVIVPSAIVTLTTNALVNLPIHYTYIRMQLQGKIDQSTGQQGESVNFIRILRSALSKTFHPFIVVFFGTYCAYSLFAMHTVVSTIRGFGDVGLASDGSANSVTVPNTNTTAPFVPDASFFGWYSSGSTTKDFLLGAVWLNWVMNYLCGVLAAVAYWAWILVMDGMGGKKMFLYFREQCCNL